MTKEREKYYHKYCCDCRKTKRVGLLEECLEYNHFTGEKKKIYLCQDCIKKHEEKI
jgi:hypothetical protein